MYFSCEVVVVQLCIEFRTTKIGRKMVNTSHPLLCNSHACLFIYVSPISIAISTVPLCLVSFHQLYSHSLFCSCQLQMSKKKKLRYLLNTITFDSSSQLDYFCQAFLIILLLPWGDHIQLSKDSQLSLCSRYNFKAWSTPNSVYLRQLMTDIHYSFFSRMS